MMLPALIYCMQNLLIQLQHCIFTITTLRSIKRILGCYLKVSCGTVNSSSSSFNATLDMGTLQVGYISNLKINEELALDMAPGSLHKHVTGEILWL